MCGPRPRAPVSSLSQMPGGYTLKSTGNRGNHDDDDLSRPDDVDNSYHRTRADKTAFGRFQLQVWDTFEDPTSSKTARFVSIGVLVTIGVSVVSFVVGTAPDRRCTWEGSLDPLGAMVASLAGGAGAPGTAV